MSDFDPSKYDWRPGGRETSPRARSPDQKSASTEQLLRGVLHASHEEQTVFAEKRVASYRNIFAIKPTWGISRLRDETYSSGTGAVGAETEGEIQISSGTDANGYFELRTIEKGQYLSGAQGEVGIGVRLGSLPAGSQKAEWGYFRQEANQNGFGFGVDASGSYVWVRRNGVETRTDQQQWSEDPLDGTGRSGATLDPLNGYIFQIDFVWYGYGSIEYSIYVLLEGKKQRVVVHRESIEGSNSIIDPNQPITARVDNNGSTSPASLDLYIGGRQFSVSRDESRFQQRKITEAVERTLTVAEGTFEPILAVREKPTFGPSGRKNSVRTALKEMSLSVNHPVEVRIGFDATTSGGSFTEADGWPEDETATEWANTGFTVTDNGVPQLKLFVSPSDATGSSATQRAQITEKVDLVFNGSQELVLFVKPLTSNTTTVQTTVSVIEQW